MVVAEPPSYGLARRERGGPLVAVCMATFEPEMELFAHQIASLREQTYEDWICLISDDHSAPAHYEAVRSVLGDDERFVLSRSAQRLGVYRNFERALALVEPGDVIVAMSNGAFGNIHDRLLCALSTRNSAPPPPRDPNR